MTDWSRATLVDTAAAIASGRVRSREVAEACLDRAARIGGQVNCFVELDAAGLRAAADDADRAVAAGAPLGPLHGVPLAHKDMYDRKGRSSGCGSKLRGAVPATTTATALAKLDAAGALEMGRLTMVEFAMGPHGWNPNYSAPCSNPWNTAHIPCGSSSGSGVAVAARLVHGSLGSDTGGSVRCPAAVTGVVGVLPTYGRVSRYGAMPMSFSLDCVGPLARTAREAARLLDVISGPDPRDASSLDVPPPRAEAALGSAAPLPRLGLARGYFEEGLHPEVAAALAEAVAVLERAGHAVPEVALDAALLHQVADLHPLVMKAEGAANHMADMRMRQEDYSFEVSQRLHAGFFIPAPDYIQALKLRGAHLRAFAARAFATVDVLVAPCVAIPVPTIAETTGHRGKAYLDMVVALTRNTKVLNWLGLPGISVPIGFTANGLPVAMQLIGRPLAEAELLRIADRYQQLTGWHMLEPALVMRSARGESIQADGTTMGAERRIDR